MVNAPSGVNASATLLKYLSILELLYAKSFPFVANAFAPLPTPATTGVTNKASLPNFIRFINFLVASSLPPSNAKESNCVGPLSNRSPKLPISSTSATNASPAAPPIAPAANLLYPKVSFNLSASCFAFTKFLEPELIAVPAFFAWKYLSANLLPSLKPCAPGTPIDTKASVSLPIPLSAATSSNGLSLSKICSISAAVFVSKPKSISSAPNENTPSGTLIKPDAIPARPAVYHDLSLFSSAGKKDSAIHSPMLMDRPLTYQNLVLIYPFVLFHL